jgi:hypothetical protein
VNASESIRMRVLVAALRTLNEEFVSAVHSAGTAGRALGPNLPSAVTASNWSPANEEESHQPFGCGNVSSNVIVPLTQAA